MMKHFKLEFVALALVLILVVSACSLGIQGGPGVTISGNSSSNALTISLGNVTGPQGPQGDPGPAGSPGPAGNGIGNVTLSSGNLTVNYTNGNSTMLGNVTGPQGATGDAGAPGATGNGIGNITLSYGNLTVNYTNGNSTMLGNITGPQGAQGATGNGIGNITLIYGNLTVDYTNGNSTALGNITGPQGAQGATGPAGPAFTSGARAYLSSSQSLMGAGQENNIVLLDGENFDYSSEFDSSVLSGTATVTSAGYLIDTTKNQFTSADVGKCVYDTTDTTYGVVTAYNSAGNLTVSVSVASGKAYKVYWSRFKVTGAGVYVISAGVYFGAAAVDSKVFGIELWKNGSKLAEGASMTSGTGSNYGSQLSDIEYLAANDYIQLLEWENFAVTKALNVGSAETYLCIYRIA